MAAEINVEYDVLSVKNVSSRCDGDVDWLSSVAFGFRGSFRLISRRVASFSVRLLRDLASSGVPVRQDE